MRRRLLAFGLIGVPLLVFAAIGWRGRAKPPDPLAEVRAKIGTRPATPLLAQLRRDRPGNAEVFFLSARQARLEGRAWDANSDLESAGSLGWPQPLIQRERTLQRAMSDPRGARSALGDLLATDPEDPDLLLTTGECELQLGRHDQAAELAGRVLQRSAADPRALYVRGHSLLRAHQLAPARSDLEAVLALGPDSLAYSPARLALATCLLDLGEFPRALELFQAARDEDPADPLPLFGVGRAQSYLGRLEDAEGSFIAVLRLRPGHTETLLSLAQVLEQRGELARAGLCLELAEEREPDRLETLARLAKILTALGQHERAERYEKRYRALDPTQKLPGAGGRPKEVP